MNLFSTTNVTKVKKEQKKFVLMCILFFLLSVGLCILLLHFATYKNHVWTIIVNSIISIIFSWLIIFIIIVKMIPNHSFVLFVESKRNLDHTQIVGIVTKIEQSETVTKNVICTPVVVDGIRRVYWCNKFADCPIQQGDKIVLTVVDKYINSYEKQ